MTSGTDILRSTKYKTVRPYYKCYRDADCKSATEKDGCCASDNDPPCEDPKGIPPPISCTIPMPGKVLKCTTRSDTWNPGYNVCTWAPPTITPAPTPALAPSCSEYNDKSPPTLCTIRDRDSFCAQSFKKKYGNNFCLYNLPANSPDNPDDTDNLKCFPLQNPPLKNNDNLACPARESYGTICSCPTPSPTSM